MFLTRLLLILVAFLLLRRVLGWAFGALGRVTGGGGGRDSQKTPPPDPERREELSDQPIEEADYEELP